ncbi:MAG TPA: acyltransferase [Steroidobacteraceae bacterium]|nr:acyltransferase [Steroidobacteraceae bacterium]
MAAGHEKSDRVPFMDLLRFVAAFSVMLYHYTSHEPSADGSLSWWARATQHGYLGVDVFFMISGFVILWSAYGRTGAEFVRARALRLYPEFWIAVALSALVFYFVPGGNGGPMSAMQVGANLTMVPQYLGADMVDGVYWTLAVELKFYALVWLLVVARQLDRLEVILYAWLAVLAAAMFFDVGGIVRALIIYPHGAHFAAGGLFFLVFDKGWNRVRAAALVVSLALCAYASVIQIDGFVRADNITDAVKVTTALVMALAFIGFASLRAVKSARWPQWIPLVGALTYPLYLTHNIGKEVFITYAGGPLWLRSLAAIAFSLVLAWLVMNAARAFVAPVLQRVLDLVGLRNLRDRASRGGQESIPSGMR